VSKRPNRYLSAQARAWVKMPEQPYNAPPLTDRQRSAQSTRNAERLAEQRKGWGTNTLFPKGKR
jgi:hypothetical protein